MTEHPEHDRLESTWDRWQRLPLGYRVNALLYVLGFISLVVLLAQVVSGSGGKPRQVEVASRAPSTTRAPKPSTTTTTRAPSTTMSPPMAPKAPAAATPSGSSGGATAARSASAAAPSDTAPIPGLPLTPNCQDSSDPACGDFSWSPPASSNLPITISVDRAPSIAGIGQPVVFTVVVSDADHPVTDNCAVIDFGDGTTQQPPCQPLSCPPTFGPWTPPARVAGSVTFSYSHAYQSPGDFRPTFEFHTDRDRCPDPYGNFGRGATTVSVS